MNARSKDKRQWAMVALAAGSLVTAGCGGDDPRPQRQGPDVARPGSAASPQQSSGDVALAGDTAPLHVRWIGDENILALTTLMNTRVKTAADYELQSWGSDTTRAFAAEMSREHSAIRYTLDSIGTSLKIAPVLPALAADVDSATRRHIAVLENAAGGRPLDRAYVNTQIASHELMIGYLAKFSAAAERSELRRVLDSISVKLEAHLAQGRKLKAQYARGDSMKAAADSARRARRRQSP
jgi:predicted outer membrane protein